MSDDYPEQTSYGNVYNYFIEFVMANPFIVKCSKDKSDISARNLNILKSGIDKSFDKSISYIKNEK